MFEVLDRSPPPRQLPSRALPLVRARCLHCGHDQVMAEQNVQRANRNPDSRCKKCHEGTFHYMTKTRFYRIWWHMKFRATDPRSPDYNRYGPHTGRGMCARWKSFATFYRDMFPTYAEDRTLERIDNAKGYSKENCRWANNMEQQANKVNSRIVRYKGEDMHLAEFCRRAGVSRHAVKRFLNAGMTGDEAVAAHIACPYPKTRKSRKRTP